MATQVFKNAMFVVNGVDLSANITSLALTYEAESLDETVMGLTSRKHKGGLKNHTFDVTFMQVYTCVDATLFGLIGCQTSIEFRACNACSSANNPIYEATYLLQSYPPGGGAVGTLLQSAVRFEAAGDLRHCAVAS